MTGEQIYQALNEVDDELLELCKPKKKEIKPPRRLVWAGTAAACLCVLAGVLALTGAFGERRWPVVEVKVPHGETSSESALYVETPWEERTAAEKYTRVVWEDTELWATQTKVPQERLGEEIGTLPAYGWKDLPEEKIQVDCRAWEIAGISGECALAVQLPEDSAFYLYNASDYVPGTLGQLIDDLNLEGSLTFGKGSHDYFDESNQYHSIQFDRPDTARLWELLSSHREANAETDMEKLAGFTTLVDVAVSVPDLGIENLSLAVTREGYLITNLLWYRGLYFYIGEEEAAAFADEALDTWEGYEIKYVEESSYVPESGGEDSAVSYVETPEGRVLADSPLVDPGSEAADTASASSES